MELPLSVWVWKLNSILQRLFAQVTFLRDQLSGNFFPLHIRSKSILQNQLGHPHHLLSLLNVIIKIGNWEVDIDTITNNPYIDISLTCYSYFIRNPILSVSPCFSQGSTLFSFLLRFNKFFSYQKKNCRWFSYFFFDSPLSRSTYALEFRTKRTKPWYPGNSNIKLVTKTSVFLRVGQKKSACQAI